MWTFQCHPDLHPDDAGKAEKYLKVQEAYNTLLKEAETVSTSFVKQNNASSFSSQPNDSDYIRKWENNFLLMLLTNEARAFLTKE